jgi:hypothetical protein
MAGCAGKLTFTATDSFLILFSYHFPLNYFLFALLRSQDISVGTVTMLRAGCSDTPDKLHAHSTSCRMITGEGDFPRVK